MPQVCCAPEVARAKDRVGRVEDPAAAAGALGVVHGVRHADVRQQPAQHQRQHHAVTPWARIAQVHVISPRLHLCACAMHAAVSVALVSRSYRAHYLDA